VAAGAAKHTLSVKIEGSGTVSSEDSHLACPVRCKHAYESGRIVTLKAKPRRWFSFDRWTKGCAGSAPLCMVAVDEPTAIRAQFTRDRRELAVGVSGPGVITSVPEGLSCSLQNPFGCTAMFGAGTVVRLFATPGPDAVLWGWQGDCGAAPFGSCDARVEPGEEVSATFRALVPAAGEPLLSVAGPITSSPPGIACPPTCSAPFAPGAAVTLLQPGSLLWGGGCGGFVRSCTVIVDGPTFASAVALTQAPFSRYAVHVTVRGGGKVVGNGFACTARRLRQDVCEHEFDSRNTVTLTARPLPGFKFASWNLNGACAPRKARCGMRVGVGKNVAVLFVRKKKKKS
jgi:hypothetical protein